MILISSVMDLILKAPEHHRLIHFLTVVDPLDDEMSEGIGYIAKAPPGMSPLNPTPKIDGIFRLLKHLQQDKNGSVSQKKGRHKKGWEDFFQNKKDAGIRRSRQKKNDSGRSAENLEEDEKNKVDLKSGKEDKKHGKDEGIEGQ
jgi:hypothetical protein